MSVDDNRTTAQDLSEQDSQSQEQNGHDSASAVAFEAFDVDDMPDMSEMQRLLEEQDAQFKSIKRGDVVEGQIVRIDQDEILVDIGLKSEGVLSTKELSSQGYGSLAELHVGDDVLVYVMQPETPEGHAVVSIKRARLERQWRIAQEQYERGDLLEAEVIDHNKGGLIVNLEGIRGFVPISQILNLKREDTADNAETQSKLQSMVGRRLQLKIIEINRNRNRLILSERLAVQEWRTKRREELLNELQVGEVRKGVVSNLSNFGAFVDLGGADGLVHISQLAWSRVNHPSEVLKVGQEVEVQVLSVDKEKKKIALSIKRAEVDPWTTVEQRYQVGQVVKGTITKIAPFGAFARIEDGVEGLIHLSELPAGQQDPKVLLKEGQEVQVRILRIESDRRRLGLSIRQADETVPVEDTAPERRDVGEGETAALSNHVSRADTTPTGETPTTTLQTPPPASPPPARQRPAPEAAPLTAMEEAFNAARKREQADEPEAPEAPEAAAPSAEMATEAATTAPAAPEVEVTAEVPAPELVADADVATDTTDTTDVADVSDTTTQETSAEAPTADVSAEGVEEAVAVNSVAEANEEAVEVDTSTATSVDTPAVAEEEGAAVTAVQDTPEE